MNYLTIHHTKVTTLKTYKRRVLVVHDATHALIVTPCLGLAVGCPVDDLGFRKVPLEELYTSAYQAPRECTDLEASLQVALVNLFALETIPQTNEAFSKTWFAEVARVTNLSHYKEEAKKIFG
jgi:hypothetical protein